MTRQTERVTQQTERRRLLAGRVTMMMSLSIVLVWRGEPAPAQNFESPVAAAVSTATTAAAPPNAGGKVLVDEAIYVSLPTARDKIRGFTVDIVAGRTAAVGYLPVRLQIKSTSSFSADRNLVVRFQPVELGQSPPQAGILCDIPVRATQGSKEVVVNRYLPKWSVGTAYKVSVFEDGVELKGYSREIGALLTRSNQPPTELLTREMSLNWLRIRGEGQNAKLTTLRFETSQMNQTFETSASRRFGARVQQMIVGLPTTIAQVEQMDLSGDWRQFQPFDGIIINFETIQGLSASSPEKMQAIRDWIMSGGTAVVTGARTPESTLSAINLQSRPIYLETSRIQYLTKTSSSIRSDRIAKLQNTRNMVQAIASGQQPTMTGFGAPPVMQPALAKEQLKDIDAQIQRLRDAPSDTDRVWSQPVVAGRVMGITGSDPITPLEWRIVVQHFGYRKSAALRRGVDPMIGDARVRRWMIPGVAQPPVYTFIGILAVFVILVGPVAYRKTARNGRGYLMFVIAPFLALTTTLAMFGYGVVADGFGTTARIRQLTWVDGKSGDAFERVRSTYFAGIRPAGGLRFAHDAEVMAYPDHNGESWEKLHRRSFAIAGGVDIDEDSQHFDSAFLPSRSQCQFISHQPRHQLGRLKLTPARSSNDSPTLDSGFSFELRKLVVRDIDGQYWTLDRIGAGQTGVSCRRLGASKASKLLGSLYNENRPLAAVSQSRRSSSSSRYDREIRDLIVMLNRGLGDTNQVITDGTFESWLQLRMQVDGDLPSGMFVAQADVTDDVVAVDGAELVESVRYLYGTLP